MTLSATERQKNGGVCGGLDHGPCFGLHEMLDSKTLVPESAFSAVQARRNVRLAEG